MVHRMDPTGAGRGVRQFKTALLERIMQVTALGNSTVDSHGSFMSHSLLSALHLKMQIGHLK